MGAIKAGEQTADMRDTIATQILNWASGADWVDDENAERVFKKLAEAPERFVSPNPGENVTWAEEASRIYQEIKDEHGLRTVREAKREARDFDDRAKRHAVEALREHGETVADDVAEEFGWELVVDVLGYDPRDRRPSIEEQAAEVVDDFEIVTPDDDEPSIEQQAAELVEKLESENEPEPEPASEPEPELELELETGSVSIDDVSVSADTPAVMTDGGWLANGRGDGLPAGKPPPKNSEDSPSGRHALRAA